MKNFNLFAFFFLAIIFYSCSEKNEVQITELKGEWKFRKSGSTMWLPANVPGCVHTDLLDNKKIPDPFYQKNELDVKWVENENWEYVSSFIVSGDIISCNNIELEFLGLDTYADVYLNDSLILKTDNMFISYSAPVKKYLEKGQNFLRIFFHSAVKVGMEKLKKVPYTIMAANENAPENERTNVYTRKAPFHYGWDWGPRLVTCGVWKPIKIKAWNQSIIEDIFIKPVKISSDKADYKVIAEVKTNEIDQVDFELWVDDKKVANANEKTINPGTNFVDIDFSIIKPELWWTNGLGGQKLYYVELRMLSKNKAIQSVSDRIGVRTIELVREKDSIGNSFKFRLNGVDVFMKGANYIPSDIFLTRNTVENYKRVVNDAVNANMNMLRFWGGAIYESEEMYDLLDENGILAWNDFMFACNMQPNDSIHLQNIKKEAEYNVKRLRNHPSIALWCGNNENLRAWNDWGWPAKVTKEQADELWDVYEKIFYNILPQAVQKYHPEITYWPSSPQGENNTPSNPKSGDEHDWRIWFGDVPFSTYAENTSRFISEYGLQSFPEMKTIKAFASDQDLTYRSSIMEHRQRSNMPWIAPGFNGNEMINTYIKRYYKEPKDFESFVYLSQVMQAEGVKFAVETHRRKMPFTMGSLYWQINDCWPTMSWSSVDYFGRWKALHYTVKKAFQPVYPIIFREKDLIQVAVVSDKLKPEDLVIEAKLLDFDGKEIWKNEKKISIKANTSDIYMSIAEKEIMKTANPAKSVFLVEIKSGNTLVASNTFCFKDYKELQFDKTTISITISKVGDNECLISLKTDKLAKSVMLFAKNTDGVFSDNNFDMIPGKTYAIKFVGKVANLEPEFIVMSVNDSY